MKLQCIKQHLHCWYCITAPQVFLISNALLFDLWNIHMLWAKHKKMLSFMVVNAVTDWVWGIDCSRSSSYAAASRWQHSICLTLVGWVKSLDVKGREEKQYWWLSFLDPNTNWVGQLILAVPIRGNGKQILTGSEVGEFNE